MGIDRKEVSLSRDLDAVTAEVEQRGRSVADLAGKGVDRALHVGLANVLLEVDFEFAATKLFGQSPSVSERGRYRRTSVGIVVVADDKRHAPSLLRQRWGDQHRRQDGQAQPNQQSDIHPAPFLPITPSALRIGHLERISLKTSIRLGYGLNFRPNAAFEQPVASALN